MRSVLSRAQPAALLLCVAAASLLLCLPDAAAHLGHVVLRAERYLKLDVGSERARVVVSLTLGAREAVRVMRAADANGDDTVSEAEADDYLERWGEGLRSDLPVELDGEAAQVRWGDGYLHPVGAVRAVPGSVEMVGRVPLDGGRHRITVRDRMRAEKYDRTDVTFETHGGTELVASGAGEGPTDAVRRLAYGPRLAGERPSALTAVVEVPGPSRAERRAVYGAAAAATLLAAAAWWALRRRARRARAEPQSR